MENKVTFGLINVHIAFTKVEVLEGGKPEYETPLAIPGAVSWTPEAEIRDYKFYADNGIYYSTFSDNGYKGDLEMAKFPDTILASMFGWVIDKIGGLVELADGKHRNFALLAEIEGDVRNRRLVYYDCSGGKPSQSHQTTQEGIEVQTQKMPLVIMPLNVKFGEETRKVTKYAIEKDDSKPAAVTAYNDFFKSVYVPDIVAETPAP